MKFIRTFAGGGATAFLTLGDELTVKWRGQPTRSILLEYGEWMRDCAQTYANFTGKSIVYLGPGLANQVVVITPQEPEETGKFEISPKATP